MIGKFVQFGAGNIGRSFIGRLFVEAGFETTFVDVDEGLVSLIERRRSYRVVVKRNGAADKLIEVGPVRAVNGRDRDAVSAVLREADYAATSVGQAALPAVIASMLPALLQRRNCGSHPLDIIIAENIRSGAAFFRAEILKGAGLASDGDEAAPPGGEAALPGGGPARAAFRAPAEGDARVEGLAGLIETSIGKMVPIMPRSALGEDPLLLFAEAYDTLIVDAKGFRGALPPLAGLKAVEDIGAYVDRKLFIHNMGHAASAYLGYRADPSSTYIWQALELPGVGESVRRAMLQSAAALHAAYPKAFTLAELEAHAEDLLERFANRALGDTLHRVGRDLRRKLARDDRLVGACLLAASRKLPCDAIAEATRAAFAFSAPDEGGKLFSADQVFHEAFGYEIGEMALREVCGLDPADRLDGLVIEAIRGA